MHHPYKGNIVYFKREYSNIKENVLQSHFDGIYKDANEGKNSYFKVLGIKLLVKSHICLSKKGSPTMTSIQKNIKKKPLTNKT